MNEKKLEDAARKERLEYFRQWRKDNPKKVKKHNENYWKKRALARMNQSANQNESHSKKSQ